MSVPNNALAIAGALFVIAAGVGAASTPANATTNDSISTSQERK